MFRYCGACAPSGSMSALQAACNAQVRSRGAHLTVITITGTGQETVGDPVHYRKSALERLCQTRERWYDEGGHRIIPELQRPGVEGQRIRRDSA